MRGTLVLAVLTVKSSYLQEIEEPSRTRTCSGHIAVVDCVNNAWRIKTALNHDIHTHAVERGGPDLVCWRRQTTQALRRSRAQHVLEFQT